MLAVLVFSCFQGVLEREKWYETVNKMNKLQYHNLTFKWDKVLKNGPSKICGRHTKILLGSFLNTLTQMLLKFVCLSFIV